MDNLTHTLAGMLVAEASCTERDKKDFRRLAWGVSVAANNLPDLDFLYTGITPGKLGYLLHHRGHTHTLVGAVLLAGLVSGLAWVWTRRWRGGPKAKDWKRLGALALGGGVLHISMDWLNSYGVHPFWPWDNHWYYGDTLFIVEPWLWMVLVPPLVFAAKGRLPRLLLGVPFFGGMALVWAVVFVPWYAALAMTLYGLGFWYLMGQLPHRRRLWAGVVGSIGWVLTLFVLGRQVRHVLEQVPLEEETLEDIVLSPQPANPLCWSALVITRNQDNYRVRKALLTVPGTLAVRHCAAFRTGTGTVLLSESALLDRPGVRWLGDFEGSVTRWRSLASTHCGVGSALRFLRVPFLEEREETYIVGDLRFDGRGRGRFSELEFRKSAPDCPPYVPPWVRPRQAWWGSRTD